ncbi:MAG: DMT family transporter, partial [Betaproteobacteria bacterium]|nr:DMT family transporter [Betaproteobacteria bacterium]
VARWLRRCLRRGLAARAHWRHYLVMGLINSALPFLLFAYAAQTLSASLLSILNSTAPIFGAVVAALWLRTPVSRPAMAGLALGLAGVVLLVGGGVSVAERGVPAALAAALVAPLCYALASAYAKTTSAAVEPFDNAHGSMWAAALLVLPLMPLAPMRHVPAAGDWLAVALLGVVCTGAAYLMYFRLIRDVGPVRALSVTFLIPVFGVLWGALFLGEPVGWSLLLGGALVLMGTALTNGVPVWPALRRVAARVRGVV